MRVDRNKAVRHAAYTLLIIFAFVLQTTKGIKITISGASADYLTFVIASIAIFEGPYAGGGFGFLAGLLLSSGSLMPEGLGSLYLALCGAVCGWLAQTVFRRVLPTLLLCGAASLLIKDILSYVFYYGLFYKVNIMFCLKIWAIELVLSLAIGTGIFFLTRKIYRRFTEAD